MTGDVKITILRRTLNRDFQDTCADATWPLCRRFEDNQEFVSTGVNMPEGFCSWAWCDIQKYVMTLSRGGNFGGVKPGVFVACCTDGFRPVFFKLERVE